jgi:hypothetical protein
MNRLRFWIVLAATALLTNTAFAQGVNHTRFQRSTLEALSANLAAGAADDGLPHKTGDKIFDTALTPRVVEVTYGGRIRPMDNDETTFVHNSFKAVQLEQMAALYERSVLFRADGEDYWLPVQSAVIPYFAKEVKAGEKIDLYVLQSGGLLRTGGWEWLFLVEDFQQPEDSPAREN